MFNACSDQPVGCAGLPDAILRHAWAYCIGQRLQLGGDIRHYKSRTQAIRFPAGPQHNPAKKAPSLAKRDGARSGLYSSPTYLLYHFLPGAASLKLHKSFAASLAYLRIDESQGLWYSIVTERKQPEIRSRQLQEKLIFQGEMS